MDVSYLQKMLVEDITAGRTPLIVIGDAGTPITGHVDNLVRLQEVCKKYEVWLHVRGHSLAAFVLHLNQLNGHVRTATIILQLLSLNAHFVVYFRVLLYPTVSPFHLEVGWEFQACRWWYP